MERFSPIPSKEITIIVLVLSLILFFLSSNEFVRTGNTISGALPSWAQSWAGVPYDVADPSNMLIDAEFSDGYLKIGAKGHYIWRTGWIWNAKTRQWAQFTFPQTSQYSGWAQDVASVDVPLKADEVIDGENFVLTYTCNWKNNRWYCGCLNENTCGRWQLQTFDVQKFDDSMRQDMSKFLADPSSVSDFQIRAKRVAVAVDNMAENPETDFDDNGAVDFGDFFLFADYFGKEFSRESMMFDLTHDRKIDFDDFFIFADNFGKKTKSCTDSDATAEYPDGRNYYTRGVVQWTNKDGAYERGDNCQLGSFYEWYCESGEANVYIGGTNSGINGICPGGCVDGACVQVRDLAILEDFKFSANPASHAVRDGNYLYIEPVIRQLGLVPGNSFYMSVEVTDVAGKVVTGCNSHVTYEGKDSGGNDRFSNARCGVDRFKEPGTYAFKVILDSQSFIEESDEGNNRYIRQVEVGTFA